MGDEIFKVDEDDDFDMGRKMPKAGAVSSNASK
jgi:hypothetical protein